MAPYTILYVDDEPDLLILGKAFLETIGNFAIDTRGSVPEGLEALRSKTYDAIISDYLMPEVNGLDFLKAVRQEFGTIPFILFTGRGREDVVIEAINYGVDFYLQKGGEVKAQFAELAHKINMAVERNRAVEERIESEKRLSTIFHASPIHQMITEFGTDIIIDINDRFLRDLRRSRSEVVGRTTHEINLMPDPEKMAMLKKELESSGFVRNVPITVRGSTGTIYTSLTSMTRLQVHGKDLVYTQSVDISPQKKAQKTINALLNATPDVSMLLDTEGKILAVNQAASVRYGIAVNDLIGRDAFTLISGVYTPRPQAWFSQVLMTGEPLSHTDDQTSRIYENNLYPVLDATGVVTAVALYSHDATDEVTAKQALRESEVKYRLVVEHSHDSIYIYRDNHFLFINKQAEELSGYSHDELMKRDIWDFIHPDDRAVLKERALQRFAGGEISSTFEARILRKDGEVRQGEFFVDIVDYLGRIAILGIARDITDKKRADEVIREREAQIRSLADNLPSGMVYQIIMDKNGGKRFLHVSAGVESLHEVKAEDVIRDPSILYDQIIPEDRQGLAASEREALKTMTPFSHIARSRTPSGKERWMLLRSAPRILPGGGTIWDGIELDITAAKLADDELKGAYEQLTAHQEELQGQYEAPREGQDQTTESEEKYRTLVEHTEDGVFIARDGVLLFVNDALANRVGYTVPELTGLTFSHIIAPEDRQMVLSRHDQRFTREKIPENYEFSLLHRDEKTRFRVRIHVGSGRFRGAPAIIGTLHDVTEERKREAALAESEARFRELSDLLPQVIYETDTSGNLKYTNKIAYQYFGYSEDDFRKGLNFMQMLVPEDLERAVSAFRAVAEGRNADGGTVNEYIALRKDGSTFPISIYSSTIVTQGRITGLRGVIVDITERKKSEDSLRQSEELYRTLITASPDGIAMVDLKGILTFVSPRALEMFGVPSKDTVLGTNVLAWIEESDRENARKRFAEIQKKGQLVNHIYRMIKTDGSIFDVEMHSSILHDSNGAVTGIVSILRDITRRKEAETALRESEENFRRLVYRTFEAIVVHQEGKIVLANDAAARIAGYSCGKDLTGKPILSFIHPDSHATVKERQSYMLATSDGVVPLIAEKFVHIDGTPIDVEVMASTTRFGGKVAIQVIFRDVTDIRRAEMALRESEDNYRRIIENMQDVFYRTNKDGIITLISTYGAHLQGFISADDIIGKFRASDFYADTQERDALMDILMRDHSVREYPVTLKDLAGNLHAVTVNSRLIYDKDGNYAGVEGLLHDVTQLMDVENALRQANRQITLMTSITRHDIRNQLLALNGWLELSRASIDDPDRMIDLINREQQIAEIIRQQIDFTTFFDDMGVKPPSWQNPAALMQNAGAGLLLNTVELRIDLPDLEIFADPLLEKVFYNLFDNALRHAGSRLNCIRVHSARDNEAFILIVEDNGAGIPIREKKRLFDRGYGKNTGLGLFLAKEILAITGLTISEKGTAGKGARFEIRIPAGKFRAA